MIHSLVIGSGSGIAYLEYNSLFRGLSLISIDTECPDRHPWEIRNHIEGFDYDKTPYVLITTHPVVVDVVSRRLKEQSSDSEIPWSDYVFLLNGQNDLILLSQVSDPDFLAHSSLMDLYVRGEFDEVLGRPWEA